MECGEGGGQSGESGDPPGEGTTKTFEDGFLSSKSAISEEFSFFFLNSSVVIYPKCEGSEGGEAERGGARGE